MIYVQVQVQVHLSAISLLVEYFILASVPLLQLLNAISLQVCAK